MTLRLDGPKQRWEHYWRQLEEGLEQNFNSLHAQREAAEAYIQSQRQAGWVALPEQYDDGGCTGANLERPALQRLLAAVRAGAFPPAATAASASPQPTPTFPQP